MPDSGWRPEWSAPPGDVLREALEERSMTQSELARRMDRPLKTINEIVNAKAAITPETALQMELALGISADFWNALETQYRAAIARQSEAAELATDEEWARQFPIRALVLRDAIPDGLSGVDLVRELLRFFGVSSRGAWQRQWEQAAVRFRRSRAYESSPPAVAAWLRLGELEAGEMDVATYEAGRFEEALERSRTLTRRRPFALAIQMAAREFASSGVALVVAPELPDTRLSGAARWLGPRTALIQVSLRFKTADQVWFSIFHDAAHLLLHPRDTDYFDDEGVEGPREQEADSFARSWLVPDLEYDAFVAEGHFTESTVHEFAELIGTAPGIVVGRLQHDGHVQPSRLNFLKERLK